MTVARKGRWVAAIGLFIGLGLAPGTRAAELSGRVVDADGQPVAGARILSNDMLLPQAASDGNGRFHLGALPDGFVTMVALHPEKGVNGARHLSDGADVVLKLEPFSPPFSHDQKRAEKLLHELVDLARGDELLEMNVPWALLAPYDLTKAVEMSRKPDGSLSQSFILRAITMLGRTDPKAAARWGLPRLDDIQSVMLRKMAMINLGNRLADDDPSLANELFERVMLLPDDDEEEATFSSGFLLELALRLKRPETEDLIARQLKLAMADDAEEEADEEFQSEFSSQGYLVGIVAKHDLPRAERLLDSLDQSKQPEALRRMVGALMRDGNESHLPKAKELLDRLAKFESEQARRFYSQAIIDVILVLGKTQPAGAVDWAYRVPDIEFRPEALAAAAQFQEDAMQLKLLRQAASVTVQHRSPLQQFVNIALLAGPQFPELRAELLTEVLQLWDSTTPQQRDVYWKADAENLVALLVSHDKLMARALLEMEWARIRPAAEQSRKADLLAWIVYSMATVDFERALEMARSIPEGEMGFRFARYRAEEGLARRLLIGPEKWGGGRGYRWNRVMQQVQE